MDNPLDNQVKHIVADLFGIPLEDVTERTAPENVSAWDSLQHLTLVLELERVFGIQMQPEEVTDLTSVGAIVTFVTAKAGSSLEV